MTDNTVDESLNLKLGQIIKIIAPVNDKLNNKIFFIDYLDENTITLINQEEEKIINIGLNNEVINDESIEQIEILYTPIEEGFARQNNLIMGVNITIEFGGNVPIIVNGEITNLVKDMIEFTVYPTKEKLYIDFEYKGISKDLNIIAIRPFIRPDKRKDVSQDEEIVLEEEELIIEDDELNDIVLNYEEQDNMDKINEIILTADDIIITKDKYEEISQMVNIEEKNKRYSLEQQVGDLLDDLLASIPTDKRTKHVTSEINKVINRFKELRIDFSRFREDGVISMPKINYADKEHKRLMDTLLNFDKEIPWMIPIIKNKKKLYDIPSFKGEKMNDYMVDTLENFIDNFNKALEMYYSNDNSINDKYKFLRERLNNLQTNTFEPEEKSDIIADIRINADILTTTENYDNLQSTIVKKENIKSVKSYMQKYITGERIKLRNEDTALFEYKTLVENEKIFLKGFVIMPNIFKEKSKIFLNNKNLYDKVVLNNIKTSYDLLKIYDMENIIVNEDFEKSILPVNLNQPYELTFSETRNYEDRLNDNIYSKFLNSTIPTNMEIIREVYKSYKHKTTNVGFVEELENFMIYSEDINFEQYELINAIVDKNITTMKKVLGKRENIYFNKQKKTYNEDNLLYKLFNTETSSKQIAEISENYNISEYFTKSETLKNIMRFDGGEMLNILLSIEQTELYQKDNFDERIKIELERLNLEEKKEDEKEMCKEFVITKSYTTIEELQNHSGKEEVYYDREYDTTRYDIMEEFEAQKEILKEEILLEKITNHLMVNVGVNKKQAIRDAISMIIGKKKIQDGEYAVLDLGDFEYRYYERRNGNWRLNEELSDKLPDDVIFCNLKEKCLNIKDKCGSIDKNGIAQQKKLLNEIADNFSENMKNNHLKQIQKLNKLKTESYERLNEIRNFQYRQSIKKDLEMIRIGNSLELTDVLTSPNSKLLNLVLSQNDVVKKYADILLFIQKYCREYEITNNAESEFWYYCIETDIPLLPTFYYELAESFANNTYNETVNKIIKKRGVESNDGDKIVDKYSGYTIKTKQYDFNEGYDKSGYKINTREVLDEDEGDIVTNILEKNVVFNKKQSNTVKIITSLITAIDNGVGVNTLKEREFMIKNIIQLINENVKTKAEYKRQELLMKKKGKTIKPYSLVQNRVLFSAIISIFIITVQTSIPEIKTSKTFPGCIKSFDGFPLNDSNKDFLNYVVCILLKIKTDKAPWTALPKVKKLTKKSAPIIEKYVHKLKVFIEEKVLIKTDIKNKLETKRQWLTENKNSSEIIEEFSLKKWVTFLPPLIKINVTSTKMLGSGFTNLLDKLIRKGDKNQFKLLNKLIGKMNEYSFSIIEKINEVVEKKELLFMSNSGVPYLENSCCNDKSNNVYNYFIEEDISIERYNDYINVLSNVKEENDKLKRPAYFYSELNTHILKQELVDNLTEETIYRAFIKYCSFNTGFNLDPKLLEICGTNKSTFKKYDSIEDKIFKMKNDDGLIYDKSSFNNLIQYVYRKNVLNVPTKVNKLKKKVFEEMLEYIKSKKESAMFDKDMTDKILSLMGRYSTNFIEKKDDEFEDFKLIIDEKIEILHNKLFEFLKYNMKDDTSKNNKFLSTIENYILVGDEIFMSMENNTGYMVGEQIKNMITDVCLIFPEMVIKNINYEDKHIPSHWKLSGRHNKEVKNIIADEVKIMRNVYNIDELNSLLNKIKIVSKNLLLVIKNIPFYSDIGEKKSIYNFEFYKRISKYFLLVALNNYISLFEKQSKVPLYKESKIDEGILRNENKTLKKHIAQMISNMLTIFKKRKKTLNVSKEKINKSVMKSKVKEKFKITNQLKNLSDEQRKIENMLKNLKLGRWRMGQTRALFEYDENQYDKEREEMDKTMLEELAVGKIDDVTMENREIYMMDHLENTIRENQLQAEELVLDERDEGEIDGEEYW